MDVLVVDDEPYILRSLEFVLRKEGLEVETATNGEEALAKVRELRPKIMFLDLMMPKVNGYDVCKAVKADEALRDTYIVILTAKGQDVDRDMGIKAGADDFMTKPFSPRDVLAKARDVLGKLK